MSDADEQEFLLGPSISTKWPTCKSWAIIILLFHLIVFVVTQRAVAVFKDKHSQQSLSPAYNGTQKMIWLYLSGNIKTITTDKV